MAFDPLVRSARLEKVVCNGNQRRYNGVRFRESTRTVTADLVGCNLGCSFCWSNRGAAAEQSKFLSPEQIMSELFQTARQIISEQQLNPEEDIQIALTAGEPTIGREHLIGVIQEANRFSTLPVYFEVETNGILLGADPEYAREIKKWSPDFLHVRISLKGATPEGFEERTGAIGKSVEYQYGAIENLRFAGVKTSIAVMLDPALMSSGEREELFRRLNDLKCLRPLDYERFRRYSGEKWLSKCIGEGVKGIYAIYPDPEGWKNWPQSGTYPAVEFESVYPHTGVARMLKAMGRSDLISELKRRYPRKSSEIDKELE